MYISRSILILLVFTFVVFLAGVDWMTGTDASWYRPFLMMLVIIVFSAWSQWQQKDDEY